METLEGRSVLVVEDDADTLALYTTALAKLGADVRCANSVEAALAHLAAWRPDAVLCDLHLPGFDGYSLIERIRAQPGLANLPVLAISGSHPEIERERSLRAGFAEHFVKPAKLGEIVEGLRTAIARHAPVT
jgi:CheY-like chemotaxis protein